MRSAKNVVQVKNPTCVQSVYFDFSRSPTFEVGNKVSINRGGACKITS